ncbi:unnamed protein product [Ranitomeya imitator]|uniref:Deubiquitinating protein VCPIP1 N-terminal domain-containing protein n=1 Tax=Ranitomeya imitator TaxID=111125 RepID=A0ABN9LLE8_9NEOB|nr:unnamed protein product [Ranitomeya imitator]
MNQGDVFECSLLGDRAFLIEPEHVDTVGYGEDRSGSCYLARAAENLKKTPERNLDRYKALFHDFIDVAEWEDIINECDPWFVTSAAYLKHYRNAVDKPLMTRRCSDTDNDPDRCSVAVWSLESCQTDRSPATNDAGEDVWSYAKGLPHLFQQGGVFYNIMKKNMGES